MTQLTGTLGDNATAIMDQAFTISGGTASKPTSKNLSPSGYFSLEKPFKGTLFIAYRPEATAVISSTFGHLKGTAPTETDVQRNLRYSNNTGPISGNSDVLENNQ
ncbi:MAG: hypothetical protein ACOH2V_01215 [Candidatus Saccharimonadaceae bacterium]